MRKVVSYVCLFLTLLPLSMQAAEIADHAQPFAEKKVMVKDNLPALAKDAGKAQQVDGELQKLTQQNSQLTSQVKSLDQELDNTRQALMQQDLQQASQSVQEAHMVETMNPIEKEFNRLPAVHAIEKANPLLDIKLGIGLVILALLLLIWFLWPSNISADRVESYKRRRDRLTLNGDADITDEYDFMNSAEGVPAQLDLARSYIAMGDHPSAQSILQTLLEKGDVNQQNEARVLLKQIMP
jgi:FimV-like protein